MPSSTPHPVARIELLIRASPQAAYAAFTEPRELRKFWLAKASAPLTAGATVTWEFKVKGARDEVTVLGLEPDKSIRVQWSDRSVTEWTLTKLSAGKTLVRIDHGGFRGSRDQVTAAALDSVQGFAYVLSELKVLLERGLRGGIVKDKAALIERAMKRAK